MLSASFLVVPVPFYPPQYIFPGRFRANGFFKGHAGWCQAADPAETSRQERGCIVGLSGY